MRIANSLGRGAVVAIVLVVGMAGVWTLATPHPLDEFPCSQMRRSCKGIDDGCSVPYPGVGLCRNDVTGESFTVSVECCCCRKNFQDFTFIGG